MNRHKQFHEHFHFFAKIFAKIVSPHSQGLRRHGVSVVKDYPDTDKTTRTLSENFRGFSLILKEQAGEKRCLGVFTNVIEII